MAKREWAPAFYLFGFFFFLYCFTLRGYLSLDEESMYMVTEALCEEGRVSIDPKHSVLREVIAFSGKDGQLYCSHDIGHSLLAMPLFSLARIFVESFPAVSYTHLTLPTKA